MPIEVELKFRVADAAALADVQRRATQLGAVDFQTIDEQDLYLAHPNRDFARTDEALRVRTSDNHHYITYKGPKLDTTTKSRREIEIGLEAGQTAETAVEFFEALGFRPVALVRKRRTLASLSWQGQEATISLDEVAEVGSFVELEIIADDASLPAARERLLALAAQLSLHDAERRSYLEMLLAARSR